MKKVLFIEDDINLLHIYKEKLSADKDIHFLSATNGKEGLAKAKSERPDLIVLDIMLPEGVNGFDVLEELKRNPTLPACPVIMLTNLDKEEKTAKEIGAIEYLVKTNLSIEDVISKIKYYLSL